MTKDVVYCSRCKRELEEDEPRTTVAGGGVACNDCWTTLRNELEMFVASWDDNEDDEED